MTGVEIEFSDDYSRYRDFIRGLQGLISRPRIDRQRQEVRELIASALNGEATEALHRLIDRQTLKRDGVFFTPKKLASRLIELLSLESLTGKTFYDPACGTGNLLLECANLLPVFDSFETTLENWGKQLWGHDLHPQFIETTKLRLVLLILKKGNFDSFAFSLDNIFPHITVGDSLVETKGYEAANFVVMNPPFTHCVSHSLTWASGKISSAAVHFDMAIRHSSRDGVIAAILPDVLRSGARYEKWRRNLNDIGHLAVEIEDEQFTKTADVNVFYLVLDRSKGPSKYIWHSHEEGKTIESKFKVNIGSVVPHRHPDRGQLVPYVHAKKLKPWAKITEVREYRGFDGTCREGPFVVIRRTSRPDDKYRAVGTIIEDRRSIAVENHLIVCSPIDGSLKSCYQLLDLLKDERLNAWFNSKIRCRHLTVGSILSAPCFEYL